MDDIVILAGKKEDYVDAVDESAKSEGWAMSYGDYDAYLMWLGSDKLHHAVARTKGKIYFDLLFDEILRGRQYSVKDVSEVPIDEVVAYDQTMYKSKREAFVRNFIARRKDGVCKVVIDQQGAIVGYGCAHILTNGGEFMGSCMSLVFDDMAFVGYYFVIPECRGKGVGRRLFDSVLTKSMKTMNIGLHSVEFFSALKMSPIYERCYGFSHYSEWATSILQISSVKPNKIKGRQLIILCSGMDDNIEVKKANEVTFSELCDYHESITHSRREDFIRFTAVFRDDAICKVKMCSLH
uniref:N-acetyltransferase domain-containing protein n=1 Tax=Parascaris equorum TaxID=6256 RepID=A0A914RLP2_PAREQ